MQIKSNEIKQVSIIKRRISNIFLPEESIVEDGPPQKKNEK